MPIPSLRKVGRLTWSRTETPLGSPRTLPLSYKPTTLQIADSLGFEPRTPWLTAKCSTFELQVQAELKQRKMVSMDGRTRTCDPRIPNAVRYQLRYIHIRNYRTCLSHHPITWVGVGTSPTPFGSISSFFSSRMSKTYVKIYTNLRFM